MEFIPGPPGVLEALLVAHAPLSFRGFETLLAAAALFGAAVGPLFMVWARTFATPDRPAGELVRNLVASGIGSAALLALVGRGDWFFTLLGLLFGVGIVVPAYLCMGTVLFVGFLRPAPERMRRSRHAFAFVAILGFLTWSVPAGMLVNRWDVVRAKGWIEELASAVREEGDRTGRFPDRARAEELAQSMGSRPILVSWYGVVPYHPTETGFTLDFHDRTEMFAGYIYHGPEGRWERWID